MNSRFIIPKRASEPMDSRKVVKKHVSSPFQFDYHEQLLATPSMRLGSNKTSFTNRFIYLVIIAITVTLLLWNRSGLKFTQNDADCIDRERFEAPNISGTRDLGKSYQVSFYDEEKRFDWVHIPKNLSSSNHFILMLVQSRPESLSRRMAIRETWISQSRIVQENEMKVLFLVGNSENEMVKRLVEKEADLFEDIIIASFDDNYIELPYKSISSFLFAVTKFPSAQLIGKIDEDVIFYPDQLGQFIKDGKIDMDSVSVYGHKYPAGIPVNHKFDTKWYISKSSFNCDKFPTYMSGTLYFMTRKAAIRILNSTKNRKIISVEDTLITGLIAHDVGANLVNLNSMYALHLETTDGSKYPLLSWHTSKNDQEFRESFQFMMKTRCIPCSPNEES